MRQISLYPLRAAIVQAFASAMFVGYGIMAQTGSPLAVEIRRITAFALALGCAGLAAWSLRRHLSSRRP
jgi:hypothetical protein